MSNAYDTPIHTVYTYEQHDFGEGGDTKYITGPANMRGRVVDIQLATVTETFTDDDTEGKIQAGISGEADKFADFGLGTTAADSSDTASRNDGDLKGGTLAADEELEVTFVGPTGGTPAGIADVHVIVAWFS